MLRHRRQCFTAEDLSATVFRDVRGEALNALQTTSDAPASLPPSAAAAAVAAPAAATVAGSTPAAVAEVGSAPPLATIIIDDSPPGSTPRAEGRDRPAEVSEKRRAEKRARVDILPGPSSPSLVEKTVPPPLLVPWRPDIEGVLGRPLT